MNLIQSTILTSLPAARKKTPSGWISFNAPCCIHNGETQDKKKRGGIMTSADGTTSYHCFNCGFKTSYVIGRRLSQRMRLLMGYLGIPDQTIQKLTIEAIRQEESGVESFKRKRFIGFNKTKLPANCHRLEWWLDRYIDKKVWDGEKYVVKATLSSKQKQLVDKLLSYLEGRGIGAEWYDFMYSSDPFFDMGNRVIIPFYWKGEVVGYTGRRLQEHSFDPKDGIKYYTDVQPGYVFNMDAQDWTRKFVIVTEGPFDAIAVSGVSILGSEINDTQKELIENLNRQIIIVPDKDKPGQKLINQAIEFGWGVAFPEWNKKIHDVAEATNKYGRLFTIQSILKSTETNKLKIDLKRKIYG